MEENGITLKTELTEDDQFSFNLKTEDGAKIVVKQEYENVDEGTCAAVDVKLEADVEPKALLRKVLRGNNDHSAGLDVSPSAVVLQNEEQKPSTNSQELESRLEIKNEKGLEISSLVKSISAGEDEGHHASSVVVSDDVASMMLEPANGSHVKSKAAQGANMIKIVFDLSGKLKEWSVDGTLGKVLPASSLNKILTFADMLENSNSISTQGRLSTSSCSAATSTNCPPPTKHVDVESDGDDDDEFEGYTCKLCNGRYLEKYALMAHQKTHHLALSGLPDYPKPLSGKVKKSSSASSTPSIATLKQSSARSTSRNTFAEAAATPTPVFMVSSEAAANLSKDLCEDLVEYPSRLTPKSQTSVAKAATKTLLRVLKSTSATTTKSTLLAAAVQREVKPVPAKSRKRTRPSLPRASKISKQTQGIQTDLNLEEESDKQISSTPRTLTSHMFKCEDCDKTFNVYVQMKLHKKLHNREKPFMCGICGSMYAMQLELESHLHSHTDSAKKTCVCFTCSVCNEEFDSEDEMLVHLKTHGDVDVEMVYECRQCDQELKSNVEFQTHMQSHMDKTSKPYKCGICKVSYTKVASLKSHLSNVHLILAQYMCIVCKCRFLTSKDLTAHLHIHEELHEADPQRWKCQHCSKQYIYKTDLVHHVRFDHNSLVSFTCSFCNSIFENAKDLQDHVKTHNVSTHFL